MFLCQLVTHLCSLRFVKICIDRDVNVPPEPRNVHIPGIDLYRFSFVCLFVCLYRFVCVHQRSLSVHLIHLSLWRIASVVPVCVCPRLSVSVRVWSCQRFNRVCLFCNESVVLSSLNLHVLSRSVLCGNYCVLSWICVCYWISSKPVWRSVRLSQFLYVLILVMSVSACISAGGVCVCLCPSVSCLSVFVWIFACGFRSNVIAIHRFQSIDESW